MELGLAGKTVLVAGGSKGIGLACAHAFLAEGAKVAITSRDPANIAAARKKLGDAVIGIAADLSNADQAAAAVAETERQLGPIDILINSAGAAKRMAPADLTPAAWRAAMDSKYFTAINLIDPVIKGMAARRSGVIVTITGSGGKAATVAHVAGGAANAALMLTTAGLAAAYASHGVRVVSVSPGTTNTGRVVAAMNTNAKMDGITPDEALRRIIARIPMGRMAEPEEIAAAVVFLASSKASYITGVTITMDGATSPFVV